MKHKQQLTATIEREGDGYVSLCPELDIASQGDAIVEARQNLQEAEVCAILAQHGFTEVRRRGSHMQPHSDAETGH